MPTIVEARDVRKTYDTGALAASVLNGVDLAVGQGERVALMGPSGCGKTTLLNCPSGLDRFDDGEVILEGVAIETMSDRRRTSYRARGMGFVLQFYNLLPVLTVEENVELPLLVAGVRTDAAPVQETSFPSPYVGLAEGEMQCARS